MPKIYVLDTSVLLFDHNALSNFQENDVVIPITVLEELDNFKIGNDTKNFEAREVIRYLDKLSENRNPTEWIARGKGVGRLKIFNSQGPGPRGRRLPDRQSSGFECGVRRITYPQQP